MTLDPFTVAFALALTAASPPKLVVGARVRTGVQPKSVTLAPDAAHLAVCNFGQDDDRNVVLLDPDDLHELAVIDFAGTATESAWRTETELLVSDFSRGVLITIDVPTATVVDTIRVGPNPKGIAITADREIAFVTNWSGRSVSVVDLRARRVIDTLKTGRRPRGVAVTDKGQLIVGAMWDHRVEAFASTDGDWSGPPAQRRVCSYPRDVRVSPDQAWLIVSCSGNRRVRWFDVHNRRLVGQAHVGPNPRTLAIAPNGDWAAVANYHGRSVSLVDLRSGTATTSEIPGTEGIVGVAVQQGLGPIVFATSFATREVIRLVAATDPARADPLGQRRLRNP